MAKKEMTEQEVRRIAKEEAAKVQKQLVRKIDKLEKSISANTEILQRLDRLLLGELGTDKEDTLKARATFAYQYAKRNTDLKIVERAIPALAWFEDWNRPEIGCEESKLQMLGKVINAYTSIKWLLAGLGITTILNALPVIKMIAEWVKSFS